MSARRVVGGIAATVAAALLVVPASALATKTYVTKAGSVTYAQVHGSNGFRLNFSENEKRYFEAHTVGPDTSTRYDLRGGSVAGGKVSADLGKLGRFDLRFVPVGRSKPISIPSWCTGPEGSWQPGYLVGRARFRGERGYTQVHLHKVSAARETWSSLRCHYLEGPFGQAKKRRATVNASRSVGPRRHRTFQNFKATLFGRHAAPRARRVVFSAKRNEGAGGISITREAEVEAPESTFLFTGGKQLPEEVEVTPPAPFSGTASFIRTAESTFEWRGDLAVEFPGIDPIRLAGPSFSAGVCALEECVSQGTSHGLLAAL